MVFPWYVPRIYPHRNVRIPLVQQLRIGRVLIDILKHCPQNVRRNALEGLPVHLVARLPLQHLPEREHHAAENHHHEIPEQNARHRDHEADPRQQLPGHPPAAALLQFQRQLRIRHLSVLVSHIFLLPFTHRSGSTGCYTVPGSAGSSGPLPVRCCRAACASRRPCSPTAPPARRTRGRRSPPVHTRRSSS